MHRQKAAESDSHIHIIMKKLICAVLDDRNEEGNKVVLNCHELKETSKLTI